MLLHSVFERRSIGSEKRIAVRDNKSELSYEMLEFQSRCVASWLIQSGCQKGDRVALYVPKTPNAIIMLFGILRVGGVYVPIDPTAPPFRAGVLIKESGAKICFADDKKCPELGDNHCLVCAESDFFSCAIDSSELPEVISDDLAAILFTSGSTGVPKGVMLTHANIVSFANWAIQRFELTSEDRFTSHAPLHFDLSTLDIFAALHAGGSVFLLDEMTKKFPSAVAQILVKQRITVWYSVPTALRFLYERAGLEKRDLSSLRLVLFAGEAFPVPALRGVMLAMKGVSFVNLYGPTESNVCTYYVLPSVPDVNALETPIGIPCEHLNVMLINDIGEEVEQGDIGEIVVSGEAVTLGYWNDSKKTNASRYLGKGDSYRTGDFGVKSVDGNIYFRGRKDYQVKIRGHRVEVGEIENVLLRHPSISDVVVVLDLIEGAEGVLVAHVVLHETMEWDMNCLRDYCALSLPVYEIPGLFECHESLPRTSTGKTDRKALITGDK